MANFHDFMNFYNFKFLVFLMSYQIHFFNIILTNEMKSNIRKQLPKYIRKSLEMEEKFKKIAKQDKVPNQKNKPYLL